MTAPSSGDLAAGDGPPRFAIGADEYPGVGKLAEESGELVQVVGKLMAYPDEPHPDGTDLRERLINEMGDALGAIWYAADANGLRDAVEARASRKHALFITWHHQERAAAAIDARGER